MSAASSYEENCRQSLTRCARICCICRRFRPSHIQVHHIVERSEGGTDDLDNLIPACIFCHQGHVHATVPFTQRFSAQELKGLRDSVYALVAEGKLVPPDTDADASVSPSTSAGASARPVRTTLTIAGGRFVDPDLPTEATELVVAMAASQNGHLVVTRYTGGVILHTDAGVLKNELVGRSWALYQDVLDELAVAGVLRRLAPHLYELTLAGYKCADALTSGRAS
jgi:hypothetical protein